ncbi:hypothetical protein A4X06_0g3423 [Tilletia controversa]|uniref:Uncharacterized protein n=2 Tax=Tilletia TaxID=13289 RepID=A0A8X7MUP9_9BASI|nr:hypothetical protein CF336_g3883 [Tilletia laevis]KAE8196201.1 hypothetical protein CF328_g4208 [Tilletia controversa]KAE8201754.1 hypothetical protein CF335_g3676 [Tilletia laevis]KAE8249015.1 hypothetical protein A4X06_0g3423 [Tilletia controversa]KAE8261474.1 hypothetical protein A4X03_0g3219 [Tilletia caries]
MQIRRSSHLFFLLSAVLFCSMAVALVAAAPAPASASPYGLEHHPVGSFLKRTPPNLSELDNGQLLRLLSAKEDLIDRLTASMGRFWTSFSREFQYLRELKTRTEQERAAIIALLWSRGFTF